MINSVIRLHRAEFHSESLQPLGELTSMSQKLRRVLFPVGVVDSGVLVPVMEVFPTAWVKVMGEGLLLNTREPLRCLGLSFTSFISGKGINNPEDKFYKDKHLYLSDL